MPRFLNTLTGDFEWHDAADVHYAILSHTWRPLGDGGEQSFEDVQELQAAAKADPLRILQLAVVDELKHLKSWAPSRIPRVSTPASPSSTPSPYTVLSHPRLSAKIKGFCKVAREAGFRLIWIDSCCINKTSSAELSEAINSMFEWYRLSDVCYVYLEDVPDNDDPTIPGSSFWKSRWHTRCWTLQEVIAPVDVVLLTQSWGFLGTRMGLAVTLEKITGVDLDILIGQATVDSVSVARRMSWAAKRQATRAEDEAYSLMGLFNVHMSPIYGEGRNAFLRLQEEIVRTIPDQSIFAWGAKHSIEWRSRSGEIIINSNFSHAPSSGPGLFTNCPADFEHCSGIVALEPLAMAFRLGTNSEDIPPLHCVFTPQGVRIDLLSLSIYESNLPRNISDREAQSRSGLRLEVASTDTVEASTFFLLQCESENGSLVALCLSDPPGIQSGRGAFVFRDLFKTSRRRGESPFRTGPSARDTFFVTKAALAKVLARNPPKRVGVSIHRHYPKEPIAYPGLKSDTSRLIRLREGLERDFGGSGNDHTFCIAPRSVDSLATLGFTFSDLPLKVAHCGKTTTLQTTLRRKDQDDVSPSPERSLHTIDLILTLTQHDNPWRKAPLLHEYSGNTFLNPAASLTTAKFSIANFVEVPATRHPSLSLRSPNPSPRHSHSLHSLTHTEHISIPANMEKVPCIELDAASIFDLNPRQPMNIIASANYILYSDARWRTDDRTLRNLRVALEMPPHASPIRPANTLWLSVDMSEMYPYTSLRSRLTYRSANGSEDGEDGRSSVRLAPASTGSAPRESLKGLLVTPSARAESLSESHMLRSRGGSSCAGLPDLRMHATEEIVTNSEHKAGLSQVSRAGSLLLDRISLGGKEDAFAETDFGDLGLGGTGISGQSAIDDVLQFEARVPDHRQSQDSICGCVNGRSDAIEGAPAPCALRLKTSGDAQLEGGRFSTSSSSALPEGFRQLVSEDLDVLNAGREPEDHDACRRENDALRTRISAMASRLEHLASRNTEMAAENAGLSARVETMSAQMATMSAQMATMSAQMATMSAQMATMSAQMATVLAARLEDPPAMQGPNAARDSRPSKEASLRNRPDGRCVLM